MICLEKPTGSPLSLSRSRFSIIYRSGGLVVVRTKEPLLHAAAVEVGAAASLGFLGEVSQLFLTGLPNPEKRGSWGSVVREGRGCRCLIEAEAGATGAIYVECVD